MPFSEVRSEFTSRAASYTTAIVETTEHGVYLMFDHVKKILNGPIVWARE